MLSTCALFRAQTCSFGMYDRNPGAMVLQSLIGALGPSAADKRDMTSIMTAGAKDHIVVLYTETHPVQGCYS